MNTSPYKPLLVLYLWFLLSVLLANIVALTLRAGLRYWNNRHERKA